MKNGMFMDGLIYSTIARNMAEGLGSFWEPCFTDTCLKHFFEHPPLALGLQALFFKLFGDSLMVERVYSLMTAIITLYIIILIWHQAFEEETDIYKLSWLPCLLWCVLPLNIYSYSNNMLENTMGIFTLAAIYWLIRYLRSPHKYFLIASGICILFAFMSKGPVGLFPFSFFGIAFIVFKKYSPKQSLAYTLILVIVPLIILLLLSLNDGARMNLNEYLFEKQLFPALLGKRLPNEPKRLYILGKLLWALLPIGLPSFFAYLYAKVKGMQRSTMNVCHTWGIFFLLLGVSASVPISISAKQYDYYLVPSLPLYAIGFSAIMAPTVRSFLNHIGSRGNVEFMLNVSACLLLICTVVYSFFQVGKIKTPYCSFVNVVGNVLPGKLQETLLPGTFRQIESERNLIGAVKLAGQVIPRNEIISVQNDAWNNWPLHGYFARYFNISLTTAKDWQVLFHRQKLTQRRP